MKKNSNIFKSIKLTLAFCVFLAVAYVLALWLFSFVGGKANGEPEWVIVDGQKVGATNVGQAFTKDIYFWGRPSAVDHNANGSGGSNKGPTNEEYLAEVEARIDSFLVKHPYLDRSEVPAEMVTASGSGLDPHISPHAASVQVKRVAAARNMSEEEVRNILESQIEEPLLGIIGPAVVNVLKLNVALDEARKSAAGCSGQADSAKPVTSAVGQEPVSE